MEPTIEMFMDARDALCARLVEARTTKFGRPINGISVYDDANMINADLGLEDAPPLVFHFIYRDAKGDLTGRGFKLMRLGENNEKLTVGGICYLRHAYRQFVAANIVELTDLATGEVFDDSMSYFRAHPFLGGVYTRAPSQEEQALKSMKDELIVLTFVSASDGELHDIELDEMLKFVCKNWDESLNEAVVAARIKSLVPDTNAFMRSIHRLETKPAKARALQRALRAVVDADGRLEPNEQIFAQYVVDRLEGRAGN
ncbi:TerB family tellurite resistance protein [Asticcacaulis solisilvae]|uniref:TerB family tellurite resistance protein n=1 Tax=Asticcacaulis solisilvae TaxID=1217274 RepID=UPI003FD775A6